MSIWRIVDESTKTPQFPFKPPPILEERDLEVLLTSESTIYCCRGVPVRQVVEHAGDAEPHT